ncbi:1-phosphatidylinositol phosphodiesterase [Elysia marginata]|uniref:1-phosphatidylinositol phosphodiesterase n=1 Tax=Elysia marginata TaxID=1093978 RepID=A0AAV4G079_9GAST|nr:1-phosphatidylinositol phosphodiesterase [Elysia marginata]
MLLLAAVTSSGLLADNSGYYHGQDIVADNSDWMATLSGDRRLSTLSLVGTHNSLSFYGGDIVQTQSMSLSNQLASGIRVVDIRVRHFYDKFAIHHGFVFQNAYFGPDVMAPITAFLVANPTETVVMRLREEYTAQGNTRSFNQTFQDYKNRNGAFIRNPYSINPTLNEIRGKIVILQNFGGSRHGINYAYLDRQDSYSVSSNWDLYSKWQKVKAHVEKAEHGRRDVIYMNFLNASGGSFPYFVASGKSSPQISAPRLLTGLTTPGWKNSYPDFPREGCFIGICSIAFDGINNLLSNYIANGHTDFTGIIMADFPGVDLIKNVILLNNSD